MPQYRIKETVKQDNKLFEPQRKFWLFWFDIPFFSPKSFNDITEAEMFISYYEMIRTKTDIKYHQIDKIEEYDPSERTSFIK
jgi:hypothetical protein